MDRQLLPISMLMTAEDIPTWGKMLGGIASALGIRELLSMWLKNRQDDNKNKDKIIAELRVRNDLLEARVADLMGEVKGIKLALKGVIPLITDEKTRAAIAAMLDD